jgi:hypothetical protein
MPSKFSPEILKRRTRFEDPRIRKWEDNIKIDIQEVGFEAMDWINLTQDKDQWRSVIKTVMDLGAP